MEEINAEEIKVGEYVRTKDGRIYQVDNENDEWIKSDIFYKVIAKHSENIIDLIEVGDYVNGKKVDSISDGYVYEEFDFDTATAICSEKNIKSIVTKEQFSSVEYRLEE